MWFLWIMLLLTCLKSDSKVLFNFTNKTCDKTISCVPKCCQKDYSLIDGECTFDNNSVFAPSVYSGYIESFNAVLSVGSVSETLANCSSDYFYQTHEFHLQENGELLSQKVFMSQHKFCLENVRASGNSVFIGIFCDEPILVLHSYGLKEEEKQDRFCLIERLSGDFQCLENSSPISYGKGEFQFLNTSVYVPDLQASLSYGNFCLEYSVGENGEFQPIMVGCFVNELESESDTVGMLISMPFLAITFIVYALLPDKNLYQYALMIYVLTLFLAYLQLVLINYITLIENEACILIGYLTLFSFTTSFFWLNVICFDIWFTFSRGRSIVGGRRSSEIKKLGFYSIYAFGVPLVLIILVYLLQTEFLDPLSIHNPKIGKGKCFLETGWPSLWYLYLEAGLIIIANLVFFSWTAVSIRKVKKETAMLKHNDSKRHAYEKSQKKFNLFIKLAFAMGINWSTEIISWFVNWQTDSAYSKIWIVTDCVNALYGVFIFFIFVFKKKTWRLLKRRYYAFRGKVYLAHSMGGTSSRPTNISTTESTVTTTVNGARRPEDNILLHDRR